MKESLMKRQLKALEATGRMLQKEYDKGKVTHTWEITDCPLCQEFIANCIDCSYCPFGQFDNDQGCVIFAWEEYGYNENMNGLTQTPIDETLSIVNQVIAYWKEGIKG